MADFLDLASLAQTINFFIQFLTKSIIYYLWTSRPDFLGLAGLPGSIRFFIQILLKSLIYIIWVSRARFARFGRPA